MSTTRIRKDAGLAISDGGLTSLDRCDADGNDCVAEQKAPGYEDGVANRALVEQRNSFTNITLAAPTTTVVKSGTGLLHALVFNKPVATGVVTIYDNTAASGTIIGTITVPANPQPSTLIYDVSFTTGLTIQTATAAQDITVAYR